MATVHYPDHVPTARKVKHLLGIRKEVSREEDSSLLAVDLDLRRVCYIPHHYVDHMRRFIWREEAIRLVLSFDHQLDIPETLAENLKMVLWYMDTLFNHIVRDAASRVDNRSPDGIRFRNDMFDSYLLIEYWVRRHEPKSITKFRSTSDRNLDRSTIEECNWKSYEESIGGVWSGADLTYALDMSDRTVDTARMLLQHMVMFYDPPIADDEDFGYTFEEHLHDDDDDDNNNNNNPVAG